MQTTANTLLNRSRSRGFSLVELMVALTIGLFLLGGMISLVTSSNAARTELDKATRQIENGRYAMETIKADVQHAGYFGEYAPPLGGPFSTPDPCDATNLGWNNATVTTPVPLYGYNDADPTAPSCTPNRLGGTDILVVRRAQTATTATATAGETYLQVSDCNTDTTPFVLGSGGFTLKKKDCTTNADLRKYNVHIYYISSCNVCSPSDNMPTLKRVEFSGGNMNSVVPLADGITNMQVKYGVDYVNTDGAPDCYISDPSNPATTETAACPANTWTNAATNWANVVAVRVYVLAQNTEPTVGYTDTKTYDMGLAATVGPFNDHYKRHAYTAVARLMNVAGRRDQ